MVSFKEEDEAKTNIHIYTCLISLLICPALHGQGKKMKTQGFLASSLVALVRDKMFVGA